MTATRNSDDAIKLFELGYLANLKVGTWSGRKMLTRADLVTLGYNPDLLPEDVVNLGRKLMVPKAEIQALVRIEQRARKILEHNSVPFCVANAHFVPIDLLVNVEQQIMEIRQEFFEKVDSFISRFDDLISKVKEAHPDFWNKCLKQHCPSNPKALRSKFRFDFYTFKIAGPGSLEEASTEEIIAQSNIIKEREAKMREQMSHEVSEFVSQYVDTMRSEVKKFCDMMQARINGTTLEGEDAPKKLTARSISCFRRYIDKFNSMNIFGDHEIEQSLKEFKDQYLNKGIEPDDLKSDAVKKSVTDVLESIRAKVAEEGEEGGGFVGQLKRRVIL